MQLNPAVYIPGSTLGTDQRRIFQGYGSIDMDGQSGNASYNSLQVAIKKRLSYGVNLNVAYTYSKSLDDYPNGGGNADIGSDSNSVLPWYFKNGTGLDRGPSATDRRHRLVLSYVWMLPQLSKANPLVRGVAGGWQLNGITTLQTGDPMTVTTGFERSLTGIGADRPDVVLGQPIYNSSACRGAFDCVSWLNPAAFSAPLNSRGVYTGDGTFGDLGKGALRGPGSVNFDASIFKNFNVTERIKLQMQGEFFNAMNHVNPSDPNTNLSAAQFRKDHG